MIQCIAVYSVQCSSSFQNNIVIQTEIHCIREFDQQIWWEMYSRSCLWDQVNEWCSWWSDFVRRCTWMILSWSEVIAIKHGSFWSSSRLSCTRDDLKSSSANWSEWFFGNRTKVLIIYFHEDSQDGHPSTGTDLVKLRKRPKGRECIWRTRFQL